jgi:hypothetical protein
LQTNCVWFYQSADITGTVDRTRLRRARRAFGAPRFRAIRKAWLRDGDRIVDVAMSTSLADAIARKSGRFERYELSRQYFHLSSMVRFDGAVGTDCAAMLRRWRTSWPMCS